MLVTLAVQPATAATVPSAAGPSAFRVLIAGDGLRGGTRLNHGVATTLTAAGYGVTEALTLPDDLTPYGQVWWISLDGLPPADTGRLAADVATGRGLYLTGERVCCTYLDSTDTQILRAVLPAGNNVRAHVAQFTFRHDVPVNATVTGGLATQPFDVTTWQPAGPGRITGGVAPQNVLASTRTGSDVLAAAWGAGDVAGGGRLALLMDIDWLEPTFGDPLSRSHLVQNLALFLSGQPAPPSNPA